MIPSGQPAAPRLVGASWPGPRSLWSDTWGLPPTELRARNLSLVLTHIENLLLRRLLRLQAAEARLFRTVSRLQGRAGRRAVRQIERERRRLGSELHTGVGQLLAGVRIQLEVISTHLPEPAAPVREALERIGMLSAEALEQVRGVSRRLHPPEWQRLTLDEALRQLWEASGVAQRYTGSVQTAPLSREPDPEVKTLVYRAAQEALSNIVRHARARRVELGLAEKDGLLRLAIQDDGIGFDVAAVLSGFPKASAGIGLRSIREQAADLGGKLLVRSGPLGTTLELSVPLEH